MNIPREPSPTSSENNDDSFEASTQTNKILDLSHLFDDQRRFFEWLYTTPALQPYQAFWKVHPSPEMDIDLTHKRLATASSGEAHMLRFLGGVWLGSNTFEFDMFHAIRDLDGQELKIIQSWIQSPFYP